MYGLLSSGGFRLKLIYKGSFESGTSSRVSTRTTLGGKRKAFATPHARRVWGVSYDLLGAKDIASLSAVAQAQTEALAWYPPDAVAGNMLSPQAYNFTSRQSTVSLAGLVQMPDGLVAHAATADNGAVTVGSVHFGTAEHVLVPESGPMSFGAWCLGGGMITGWWRDASGAALSGFSAAQETFGGWRWVEASFTPPAGAVFASLTLARGVAYAAPSVSWGNRAHPTPGTGCPKAIVDGLSSEFIRLRPDDNYFGYEFTITEVG